MNEAVRRLIVVALALPGALAVCAIAGIPLPPMTVIVVLMVAGLALIGASLVTS